MLEYNVTSMVQFYNNSYEWKFVNYFLSYYVLHLKFCNLWKKFILHLVLKNKGLKILDCVWNAFWLPSYIKWILASRSRRWYQSAGYHFRHLITSSNFHKELPIAYFVKHVIAVILQHNFTMYHFSREFDLILIMIVNDKKWLFMII